MRGTYTAVVPSSRSFHRFTDLGTALRWFDRIPRATHLVGPLGMIVADRRH